MEKKELLRLYADRFPVASRVRPYMLYYHCISPIEDAVYEIIDTGREYQFNVFRLFDNRIYESVREHRGYPYSTDAQKEEQYDKIFDHLNVEVMPEHRRRNALYEELRQQISQPISNVFSGSGVVVAIVQPTASEQPVTILVARDGSTPFDEEYEANDIGTALAMCFKICLIVRDRLI